jgi:hypothetical protein
VYPTRWFSCRPLVQLSQDQALSPHARLVRGIMCVIMVIAEEAELRLTVAGAAGD